MGLVFPEPGSRALSWAFIVRVWCCSWHVVPDGSLDLLCKDHFLPAHMTSEAPLMTTALACTYGTFQRPVY